MAELRAELAAAKARIAELERAAGKDSRNSSKPPSSDGPSSSRSGKKPTGRRPGGQPGHRGHGRALVPAERVDVVKACIPTHCEGCGSGLCGSDPEPLRHQVVELPPVRAEVTEFQVHTLTCGRCGVRTVGELPRDAPVGQFGPRLCALVAILSGAYSLSKRQTQRLLAEVFEIPLSLGSVKNIEHRVSDALEGPVDELREHVKTRPVVNLDETGWFEGCSPGRKARAWLWVATHGLVSVFLIALSRGSEVAKELVGEDFAGTAISDRWSGYAWLSAERRQLCWAHLIRDFREWTERSGPAMLAGRLLLKQIHEMFVLWHRHRDGAISRKTLQKRAEPVREQIVALLRFVAEDGDPKAAGMARMILKVEPALFTFIDQDGVEPTNNAAERALRRSVIWRKLSFGTQSDAGSRFAERILTVVATARAQKINLLAFVASACAAAWCDTPPPSLLPR